MKKKVLLSAPIFTRSGYGEMARLAYRSLMSKPEEYEVYVNPTNWGQNGWVVDDSEESQEIDRNAAKTAEFLKRGGGFDVSIQCTIPNEWKPVAPVNIGYTAGIETNWISPSWLEPSQAMDKIVVISEHARSGFTGTTFQDQHGNTLKVTTPTDVVHFPFFDATPEPLDLELEFDRNFLTIAQWGPRKNLEQTITEFVKEFMDEEVGLVVKTNISRDNTYDREQCEQQIKNLVDQVGTASRKCKVYLLHGTLTRGELASLYTHPKIKAIISTSHGEGYGLPLFEAACCELPVLAPEWSGHLDFLYVPDEDGDPKRMFGKIDYELKPIPEHAVWNGVLERGTSWCYPIASSVRQRMRDCLKAHDRYKGQAKKLAKHLKEEFSQEKIYEKFNSNIPLTSTNEEVIVL
jgi:glycosyltransferase involved in cell wall biosynthesis